VISANDDEPDRAEVDGWPGVTVLEFGAGWCPICQAARSVIDRVIAGRPDVRHRWIEDGPGRPLGRSFRVKLWPTLVVLRDGVVVARVVRPRDDGEVRVALAAAPAPPT
jgi:thioredoxin 1